MTAVYPGGTKTSFIANMVAPESLGEVDLVSRYDRTLVGPDTKVLDLLVRLSGSAYQRFIPPLAAHFVPPPTR